jgi:hypothetical protein
MPENCNVQIDPNGTGETLEELIDAAVAEIKPSVVSDVLAALPTWTGGSY